MCTMCTNVPCAPDMLSNLILPWRGKLDASWRMERGTRPRGLFPGKVYRETSTCCFPAMARIEWLSFFLASCRREGGCGWMKRENRKIPSDGDGRWTTSSVDTWPGMEGSSRSRNGNVFSTDGEDVFSTDGVSGDGWRRQRKP
jgi:hypothetical protein